MNIDFVWGNGSNDTSLMILKPQVFLMHWRWKYTMYESVCISYLLFQVMSDGSQPIREQNHTKSFLL